MSNPLHASYYADKAVQRRVSVVENVRIARDTYRARFHCPEIAQRITPGQFMMMRLADFDDPLLGRALALYDKVVSGTGEPIGIDVVYLVMGKMTSRLSGFFPGQQLEVWGPLGNGFEAVPTNHLIMVAGGIGQTPFVALGKEYLGRQSYGHPPRQVPPAEKVTLCYGARTADFLAGLEDFDRAGVEVRLSTDDGTRGHHGLVTDLLREELDRAGAQARVVCCGPEPMMEAVAEITAAAGVACQVSLESPMACGIGICFSCVAKVREPSGDWDYKRTCVEGPVFDANNLEW